MHEPGLRMNSPNGVLEALGDGLGRTAYVAR